MSKRARAWCQAQTGSFGAEHLRHAVPGMTLDYARTFLSTDRAMGFLRRIRRGRYAVKRETVVPQE
jgi:predicted transcriptional regulator of viral defense system